MNDEQHRPPGGGGGDGQLRYPLPAGTRIDHYVIREVLGAGGFGITYLAEHEGLGKQYAIKEYFPHAFSYRHGRSVRPSSTSDGTYKWGLDRFVTEARALARFKHPAIVDVTSIFEANGTAYIVLAYESGSDMTQWLKRMGRPPSQEELDRLLTSLLSALEEVHRHNMMHRDISPDNLLIREDGRPVLIDFGSARESIRGRARALSAIVKHGYSPPEQYTSKPELQGPWTDIYALSATLYRAISGKLPPDATERLARDDLLPLGRLARAPYRQGFLEAIDRGLRMKVEERPQSIIEWREQLFQAEPLRQPPRQPSERSDPGDADDRRQAQLSARPAARSAVPRSVAGGGARPASQVPLSSGSQRPSLAPAEPASSSGARPAAASRAGGSGGSRRLTSGSSIPKSERPDLSWLDEADDKSLEDQQVAKPASNIGQTVTYAFLGLLGGAVMGGLLSIVLASIVSTECFADRCIFRYLAICASLGAMAGIIVGIRLARQPAPERSPPQPGL
ncbi:MAG: serine/threonine protein kinase [Hyphomicrobiaceae bacterium]